MPIASSLSPHAPLAYTSPTSCKLIAVFNFHRTCLLLLASSAGGAGGERGEEEKSLTLSMEAIQQRDTGNIFCTPATGCSHVHPSTWLLAMVGDDHPCSSTHPLVLPCGTPVRTALLQAGFRQVLLSLELFPSSPWRGLWGQIHPQGWAERRRVEDLSIIFNVLLLLPCWWCQEWVLGLLNTGPLSLC